MMAIQWRKTRPKTSRTGIGLVTTSALVLSLAAASVSTPAHAEDALDENLAHLVNTFVGTSSEGNAYPGATAPFGMVQLSPDNKNSYQNTSYDPNTNGIWGFSHRHINSAGCPAAGEILTTPSTTQQPITTRTLIAKKTDGTEDAHAGYYTVELANEVKAEVTALERTGFHRYTFPATTHANLSFNVGQTLRDAGASHVRWVDDQTLEGWAANGGFCGSTSIKQKVYFSAKFDRPANDTGLWNSGGIITTEATESSVDTGNNGAFAVFDTVSDQSVEVAVGISFVDEQGARNNREIETNQGAVAFDQARAQVEQAWNDQLSVIDIEASEQARIIFYTQLYKALLSPTIGSDADGRYFGMDQQVHHADGWTYYQTFSLWDTYRTQATLHGMIAHDRAEDIVRSMYQHRVEGGWFPRWSLGAIETNVMAGDPVSAWVAENFTLGTVPEDIAESMWEYLTENADNPPAAEAASVGRQSAKFYIENQHIPFYFENEPGLGQQFEEYRHGGSSTMEFAISDAAIGAAAQRLGKSEDAARYLARGQNWRRLWNSQVPLSGGFTGIVNAVFPDGTFNQISSETAAVQQSGFHEGTQWQYQWMANQDFAGLQEKMGGVDEFLERLDYYMAMPQLIQNPGQSPSHWAAGGSTYYTSIGYNPGNEPTIMNPWLYSSAGKPAAVNDVLAANLNRFPNTPGGGVGNDDLGTMASWYVMATLGFQPVVPGSGMLALNTPRVQSATIKVGDGKTTTVTAPGAHESLPRYIESLELNGSPHSQTWVDVSDILSGGSLDFSVSTDRDTSWGTNQADWLPSVSAPKTSAAPEVSASAVAFQTGKTQTVDLGSIRFTSEESEVPLEAELSIGDTTYPVDLVADEDGWRMSLTAAFASAGSFTGSIKVSAADVPKFAPKPFTPVTAEVEISVTTSANPEPEPEPVSPTVTGATVTIIGNAKVGNTLSVRTGSWTPQPVTLSYQWLRDNGPIAGATRAQYTLTAADAKHEIWVRVTGERSGHLPAFVHSKAVSVKKARAKVSVTTVKRSTTSKRGSVKIQVTSAASARPQGRVTVRFAGKKLVVRLAANRNGAVKVKLPRATQAGKQQLKVRFVPKAKTARSTLKSKTVTTIIRVTR